MLCINIHRMSCTNVQRCQGCLRCLLCQLPVWVMSRSRYTRINLLIWRRLPLLHSLCYSARHFLLSLQAMLLQCMALFLCGNFCVHRNSCIRLR